MKYILMILIFILGSVSIANTVDFQDLDFESVITDILFTHMEFVGVSTPTATGIMILDGSYNLYISTGIDNRFQYKKLSQ